MTFLVSCAASPPAPGPDEALTHATNLSPPTLPVAHEHPTNSRAKATHGAGPEPTAPSEDSVEDPVESDVDPETCLPADARARIAAAQPHVTLSSTTHGVDPDLINGLIWVESKFKNKARGPSGAQGLMQLMPRTARDIAKKLDRSSRPYDASFNVDAGTYYLSQMLARFDGNEVFALASYNRGAGMVKKWEAEGMPLPEGVQRFVDGVQRARRCFSTRRTAP